LWSFFTLVYVLLSQGTNAQASKQKTYKLYVNLEKAPFDSLYLQDYTAGRNVIIPGIKTGNFTWEITIPDEIVRDSETMQLLSCVYDSKSNSQRIVRFISKGLQKNVNIVNVGVDGPNNYIYGTYLDSTLIPDDRFKVRVNNKDSVITGNTIIENFQLVIKDESSDMAVRAHDPFFSWFLNSADEAISYESYLASYTALAKKFPDSRFLMSNLAGNLNLYKSKEDIKKVYQNFSTKHKYTIWAKKVESFLYNTKFTNKILPTTKNTYEKIVRDVSKYNLVVFTASWCGPCIEEIPLLKKIYKDLGKNLILTYVSVDRKKDVTAFVKLTREKAIPWRSLFAYENLEENKRIYFVESIPHSILVFPDQTMEIIDVRKDSDRLKLYSLIKSSWK